MNGGIQPSGLFWTVQLSDEALDVSDHGRFAEVSAKNVPVIDSFQFLGPNQVPAKVTFDVTFRAKGEAQDLGMGTAVDPTDPAAFLGSFSRAVAKGSFSGSELGFTFSSDPGASSGNGGYAEMGTERNGSFLT